MSQPLDMPSNLAALLMPLTDRSLILPQVAMAELVTYRPTKSPAGAPSWYLGQLEWRDLRLPLLSFEAASGGHVELGERCRIAIINAQGGRDHVKFIALLLQGIPRSVRIDQTLAAANVPLMPLEVGAAMLGTDVVRIPDLAALEQLLEDAGLI
jgi:chemosensory pili system protein ChpC